MGRRIELELTSKRADGTWTWRAAGAREPKGELVGSLLPPGSAVGEVLQADADFDVDGITVTAVHPRKDRRGPGYETLEVRGPTRSEAGVTTALVGDKKRSRPDRTDGTRQRDHGRSGDPRRDRRERGERKGGPGEGRGGKDRPGRSGRREARPDQDETRVRRNRLKPRRVHRGAVVKGLPEEQRALANLVLKGGVPEVRLAVERQNEWARRDGHPRIDAGPLVALAERLVPRLRAAEWRDRADAALAEIESVDLRDLRSVVTAAETAARDEAGQEVAGQLRRALTARVEQEHATWLRELHDLLVAGRTVRALRLSSRPPKAGAPLPSDLARRLAEQTTGALTGDISQERFGTVLEAASLSPVHRRVAATSIPAEPSDELLKLVRRMADRVPGVAAQFGVTPATSSQPSQGTQR